MKISKALVFDIKRFAVHDGYGLRTTVYLQKEGYFISKIVVFIVKDVWSFLKKIKLNMKIIVRISICNMKELLIIW